MKTRFLIAAVLAAWGASASAQQDMSKVEVRAVQIRPGVAVLFGNGGNIGVSYGPDGTILIDDQFAPLTAKIQAAVQGLGANPTRFLINTHWHGDHAGGNENFGKAGALIFAHDNVRVRLATGRQGTGNDVAPAPKEALPVVTYGEGINFHVNGDEVSARFVGGGHTDGDSVIVWQRANVIHTGDMFMNKLGFPFIDISSGGNVEHLIGSLGRVIAMADEKTVIIPGHGELADKTDLIAFRAMVQTAVDKVKALKDAGKSVEEAKSARPLAGVSNAQGGFVSDDDFVAAIYGSLQAHSH